MGLDQYAFAVKDGEQFEIMYWRKHANLEGWMSKLYHDRGGTDIFNCKELRLSKNDLLKLKEEHRNLPVVAGFFWGQTSDYKIDDTEKFIHKALEHLEEGYEVIYTSWW